MLSGKLFPGSRYALLALVAFLVTLLALAGVCPAAQMMWTPNGEQVSAAVGNQEEPRVISDGFGGAIIAWEDNRGADTDIYAQRVDSAGNTLWTADGVAVCTATGNQLKPELAPDGGGGAIITWEDRRGTNYDIYAQRVDSAGNIVWAADGVPVVNRSYDQRYPAIAGDGAGGSIVVYQDRHQASPTTYDIYAQQLDPAGNTPWDPGATNGAPVCTATGSQLRPRIIPEGTGAITTWHDARNGASDDNIYAQRMDGSGAMFWIADGEPVCTAPNEQENPVLVTDGFGGAVITWDDERSGSHNDVYTQRVNPGGTMLWTADGVAVCTQPGNQILPQLTSAAGGGAVITWPDERVSNADIYTQRVDSAGATMWTADGERVCGATGDQRRPYIVTDGFYGGIISWWDRRTGGADIYVQRVAGSGEMIWTADGQVVCDAAGDQDYPRLAADGNYGAIIAWQDDRGADTDIYAQRVTNDDPGLTGITPAKEGVGKILQAVITGNGFETNAAVRMKLAGRPDIVATDINVVSRDRIDCRFNLAGGEVGLWGLEVENPDGGQGALPGAFDLVNTRSGTNVSVTLGDDTTVSFETVTTPGSSTVTECGVEPVASYEVFEPSGREIGTDASWDGPVDVTFDYQDMLGRKLTPEEEEKLVVLALEGGNWVDRTYALDTTAKTVTARVTSLSRFQLALPIHHSAPGENWYFAEGYTTDGGYPGEKFDTYFAIANPGETDAEITATFVTNWGLEIVEQYTITAESRFTLHADEVPGLTSTMFSTHFRTTNRVPVVVERSMYFSYYGRTGGHSTIGATALSDSWYMAEGYTGKWSEGNVSFDTYILIGNPNPVPASASVEFETQDRGVITHDVEVAPHSRATVIPNSIDGLSGSMFSVKVTSDTPVVAERSMYFEYRGLKGGHCSIAAPAPATSWFLAEGYTAGDFDTYILIGNPNDTTANVLATFMTPDGISSQEGVAVPPHARRTFIVDGIVGLEATEVATALTSDQPVVVERSMYFDYEGRQGGHCSIGAADDPSWVTSADDGGGVCIADGYTGEGFDTYILIANPGEDPAAIRVSFLLPDSDPVELSFTLDGGRRATIHANDIQGLDKTPVATRIESTNGVKIIAERALYFTSDDGINGGHDSIGFPIP